MQIHELNNFTGTLGAGAYLAVDDGNDTGKLSTQQLLAATEARIDNIIAGPAPSAEEIVDARRGADGVTYNSLGTAIRTQVTDLKSAINYIRGVPLPITGFVQGRRSIATYNTVEYMRIRATTDKVYRVFAGDVVVVYNITSGFKYGIGSKNGYDSGWQTTGYVATFADRKSVV